VDTASTPLADTPPGLIAIDTNRYYTAGRLTWLFVQGFVVAILIALVFVAWIFGIVFALSRLAKITGLTTSSYLVVAVIRIIAVLGPVVLAVLAVQHILGRRAYKQATDILAQESPADRRRAGEAIVERYVRSAYARSQEMTGGLKAMVDAAWSDTVILSGPAVEGWDIVPISAPIEPVGLDRTDSAYLELAGLDPDSDKATAPMASRSRNGTVRLLSRCWHVAHAVGTWLAPALMTIMAVVEGIGSLRAGRLTAEFLIWVALALTNVPFLQRGVRSNTRLPNWFLVAGGLIHRKRSWLFGDHVHLFTRGTSALFVYTGLDGRCHFGVADKETHRLHRIAESEMMMVLRTWLSPARPPSHEQVERLFSSSSA